MHAGLAEAAAAQQLRRTPRRSCSWSARATRRASRTGATSLKPGVAVITPNPKTSGGARWNYLAAWGYALKQPGGDDAEGAGVRRRSSTRTCRCSTPARAARPRRSSQRGIGDVLLAWENEALSRSRSWARASSRSSCRRSASSPSRRSRSSTRSSTSKGTREVARGVPRVPVHARRAGDRRQALLPAARCRRSRRSTRRSSRR